MVNMGNYEQQSIFGFPEYKITKKIRLIEMFGGIGSQAMALRDLGADFEHHRLIEFDKYCVQSYNAIHHTNFEPTDIRDVHRKALAIKEKEKYCYILTYSFPCTDLSVAGKMRGMSKTDWENGESTRSGLLWEVERILKELPKEELPDVLLMENVPQVHSDQNTNDFMSWQDFLNSLGYFNFIQDLNAKNYGIPQNRERCLMVSILSDDFISYEFPKPIKLEKVMRDFLEKEVNEKYYIQTEKAQKLVSQLLDNNVAESNILTADLSLKSPKRTNIANCITAREDRGIANVQGIGNAVIEKKKSLVVREVGRNPDNPTSRKKGVVWEQRLEIKEKQGLVGTLTTVQKDNMILECDFYKQAVDAAIKGNAEVGDVVDAFNGKVRKDGLCPTITTRPEGKKTAILPCVENKIIRVGQISNEGSQCGTVVATEGLYPTISAGTHGYANPHVVSNARIRKLTPKECWRLMGYTDEDFDNAKNAGVSNSQLYKQAGNAIVKQVLMAIFKQML